MKASISRQIVLTLFPMFLSTPLPIMSPPKTQYWTLPPPAIRFLPSSVPSPAAAAPHLPLPWVSKRSSFPNWSSHSSPTPPQKIHTPSRLHQLCSANHRRQSALSTDSVDLTTSGERLPQHVHETSRLGRDDNDDDTVRSLRTNTDRRYISTCPNRRADPRPRGTWMRSSTTPPIGHIRRVRRHRSHCKTSIRRCNKLLLCITVKLEHKIMRVFYSHCFAFRHACDAQCIAGGGMFCHM